MKSTFDSLYSYEEEGVEVFMGTNSKGDSIYFTIAESGNKAHEKATRKYQKALASARKNPKKEHEILARIMAESIVLDWRGVLDEDKKELPCTMENKIEAFTKYKKLFYAVLTEASNEENFIDDELELEPEVKKATEKNLKKS